MIAMPVFDGTFDDKAAVALVVEDPVDSSLGQGELSFSVFKRFFVGPLNR